MVKDDVGCFAESFSPVIRHLTQCLSVSVVDENRPAAGGVARIDVTPAVAHHPALREVDAQCLSRAQQHSRLGFATIAVGRALAGMIADLDSVGCDLPAQVFMERFHGGLPESAASDIGLIRGHDEKEAGLFQFGARFDDAGENLEFLQGRRGIWFAVTGERAVEDAVAVEEDGFSSY